MHAASKIFFISVLLIGMHSCITPKDARVLKKNTKEWRDAPAVLEAYSDSPFSASFLTLRKNNKFERVSSGIIQSFHAGSWTINQDTIKLSYVDSKHTIVEKQYVLIDRKTSTLIFEGDSIPEYMRLKIMLNDL